MVEHSGSLIDALTTSFARLVGFLAGIGTVYTSTSVERVDVLNFVLFSIGPVDFPISSCLTLMGAFTALLIASATVFKAWEEAQARRSQRQ